MLDDRCALLAGTRSYLLSYSDIWPFSATSFLALILVKSCKLCYMYIYIQAFTYSCNCFSFRRIKEVDIPRSKFEQEWKASKDECRHLKQENTDLKNR